MQVNSLIDAYLTYSRVEGRTPKTIRYHAVSLSRLAAYLEQHAKSDLTTVTRADLRGYIHALQTEPGGHGALLAPHSVATYARSMRAFFAWLTEEEYIAENPAAKVSVPKTGEAPKDALAPEDIRALLAACDGPYALRDRAIILTLYDTGLRASELTSATLDNLIEAPPSLQVLGKGRKVRTVPLGRETARAIRRYLRERNRDSKYVFCNRSGDALTTSGLAKLLARRGTQAGVTCHAHLFRHSFAIAYVRNGGDLFSLQRILGHTTLEMVRHYARLAASDVLERHREYSPADRLRA